MDRQRVVCFIDGFNLYHSILRLKTPYLKWVNYWSLASVFISPQSQKLINVFYFSAYATWLPEACKRHAQYWHSDELIKASSGKAKIKVKHLQRCLLPETVCDADGHVIVTRPKEYTPPLSSGTLTLSPYYVANDKTNKTTL